MQRKRIALADRKGNVIFDHQDRPKTWNLKLKNIDDSRLPCYVVPPGLATTQVSVSSLFNHQLWGYWMTHGEKEVLYETKSKLWEEWIELVFIERFLSSGFPDFSILQNVEKRFSFFQWKFENLILQTFVQKRSFSLIILSFSSSPSQLRPYVFTGPASSGGSSRPEPGFPGGPKMNSERGFDSDYYQLIRQESLENRKRMEIVDKDLKEARSARKW